ncbi:hypothetical protein EON65_59240 [archaeon]|nr:MAG: hypothetical protein EON65_59240 [archaeon]
MENNIDIQASSLPKLQCIQLPALVRRLEQAFQMLGGETAVKSAFSSSKPTFTFSYPDDPSPNSTITSTHDNIKGFVVRIRRKKGSKGAREDSKVTVVGYVDGVHIFRSMLDFQVIHSDLSLSTSTYGLTTRYSIVYTSFLRN